MPSLMSPIIVPPSGSFDGVDGAWSTFLINIGDDGSGKSGQNFKTLVSTSRSATLLPLSADWCNSSSCAENRGILPYHGRQNQGYQPNSSTKHQDLGLFSLELAHAAEESTANARYGLDSIGIGRASPDSPVLVGQLVAGYVHKSPFMGSIGLSTAHLDVGSGPISPYLANLNPSGAIASLSYSYTAGASYRNKGVLGSLVLGGYDRSRFAGGVSVSMPTNSSLIVGVQSITIAAGSRAGSNIQSATAGSASFFATVDSSVAYFQLPRAVCDVFEALFMLTYDPNTGFYLVNDTVLEYNKAANATIAIQVGDNLGASINSVNIDLPYDAFDLRVSFPAYPTSAHYFPIRRAVDGINIIGRTFLQESMLIVDYERRNFTVARARYSSPLPSADIVAIETPERLGATHTDKVGVLVVVVPVVVVAIVIIIVAAILWRFHPRFAKRHQRDALDTAVSKQNNTTTISELPSGLLEEKQYYELNSPHKKFPVHKTFPEGELVELPDSAALPKI